MNLDILSKIDNRSLILCAAGIILSLVMAVLGGVAGFKHKALSVELDELNKKITDAEKVISVGHQIEADYGRTISIIKDQIGNTPPAQNYYSWGTEVIYSISRKIGLEIDSIDEVKPPVKKGPANTRNSIVFGSYTLRISAHGDYESTKKFLSIIAQEHPLMRILNIEIGVGRAPENNDVELVVQWPFNLDSISQIWDEIGVFPKSSIDGMTQKSVAPSLSEALVDSESEEAISLVDEERVREEEEQSDPFLSSILNELKSETAETSTKKEDESSLGSLLEDIKR